MSICIMLTAFCWSTLAALTDAHMAKTRHERALGGLGTDECVCRENRRYLFLLSTRVPGIRGISSLSTHCDFQCM